VRTTQSEELERLLQSKGIHFERIGVVSGQSVVIDGENWGAVSSWKGTYETLLSNIMTDEQ
jgi:phosphoribosylformylglycinamidine synthase